jgi:hypothetical protein
MFGWVWGIFHGPARQRRFLVEVMAVMELARAALANAQLPREGRLGRDDLRARLQAKIDQIQGMLDRK